MTFYRNFADKYDLVERICRDDLMIFTKVYGANADWKDIVLCILNTIQSNSSFYGKILKDDEACSAFLRALVGTSKSCTGGSGSTVTTFAWKEVLYSWAKNGFTDTIAEVYTQLVGAMPLHEVFTGEQLTEVIKAYESNTLDDFKMRKKSKGS